MSKERRDISQFIIQLPFKEKKRFIEAIIGPTGKILVRYLARMDTLDYADLMEIGDDERLGEPLTDRKLMLDFEFDFDADRIETAIGGLDRRTLLGKIGPVKC